MGAAFVLNKSCLKCKKCACFTDWTMLSYTNITPYFYTSTTRCFAEINTFYLLETVF